MKRDLRHVLRLMAVVLPVMIVVTVLTSGNLPGPSRSSSVAHAGGPAIRRSAQPRHTREGRLFEAPLFEAPLFEAPLFEAKEHGET